MAKVLVIGGTRFFGKVLVKKLLSSGHRVCIGSRGNVRPDFPGEVEYLRFDRHDVASMSAAINGRKWDIVYDQLCMDSVDAEHAIEIFGANVGKYVLTSSIAVYDQHKQYKTSEQSFDPFSYLARTEYAGDVGYSEGKRLAEAVLYQKAEFPVIAVRFPIVLGADDYTGRLLKPIRDLYCGTSLQVCSDNHAMSLISDNEAGAFLAWLLSMSNIEKPINACSNGCTSPRQIISMIEHAAGRQASFEYVSESEGFSLINHQSEWTMSNHMATQFGYSFSELDYWLVRLIKLLTNQVRAESKKLSERHQ